MSFDPSQLNQQELPSFLKWMISRGAGESSQIREQIRHNMETQVTIRIAQAFTLTFLATPMVIGGLGIFTSYATQVVVGIEMGFWDAVFLGTVSCLIFALLVWLLGTVNVPNEAAQLFGLIVLGIVLTSMIGIFQRLGKMEWGWLDSVLMTLGLGLMIGGGLLMWYFVHELFNSSWPPSPMVKLFEKMLDRYQAPVKTVYVRQPVLTANKIKPEDKPRRWPWQKDEDEATYHLPVTPAEPAINPAHEKAKSSEWIVDPVFGNMCWFVSLAHAKGTLSRNALIEQGRPALQLPFEELEERDGQTRKVRMYLRRAAYEMLIQRLVDEDLIDTREQRQAPVWVRNADTALYYCMRKWKDLVPELPFPFYNSATTFRGSEDLNETT